MPDEQAVITGSAPANQVSNQTVTPGSGPAPQPSNETPIAEPSGSQPSTPPEGKEHQLLRQRAQKAEAEAAYYRGLAEGRKPESAPAAEPEIKIPPYPKKAPELKDFESVEAYETAIRQHTVEEATWTVEKKNEIISMQDRAKTFENTWNDRLRKERETAPELDEALSTVGVRVSPALAYVIKDSELGPKITVHLHKNPQTLEKLLSMPPAAQAREIGKLEIELSRQAAPPPTEQIISQAPEPVKPIPTAGNLITTDYTKMSTDDFMKKRNAEARKSGWH